MVKTIKILGVIVIMALLLMSSVPLVTQLATAADGEGEPEEITPYEACGMGFEAIPIETAPREACGMEVMAVPIEEAEPEEDTGGEMSVEPAHFVLESPVGITWAEPPRETAPSPTGWTTMFTDGFEGAFPGSDWTIYVGGVDAYWGKDSANPCFGSYSAFCAKDGTEGVPAGNYYPNNMETWMVYGPFDLSDATDATLDYSLWLDSEYGYDFFWCMASTDESQFYGSIYSGWSDGWQPKLFDLTDVYTLGNLCGQSNVWIAFIFTSDDIANEYLGAFVDDVVIHKYTAAAFDLEAVDAYLSTVAGDMSKEHVVVTPTEGQDVYLHFEVSCTGSGTTPTFRVDLNLDGPVFCYWQGTVAAGYTWFFWCLDPWTATCGDHTLTGVADVYDNVPESDEANNEAEKVWNTPCQFDLEAVVVYLSSIPADWEQNFVVDTPTVGQDVYFHFIFNCYGEGFTPELRVELNIDGSMFCYYEGALETGLTYTFWCNDPWTNTAGPHTLTGVADVYDDVIESHEDNNEANKDWGGEEGTWTFMVYLDGDNNLEGAYIYNFNLMELAANNPNVNVIVQFDRIPGEDSSNGDWTTTRRYEVRYDTNMADFASYTLDVDYWELGELNMADPAVLSDFVLWAKTNYPADHYCLALVNHGGGWEPTGGGQLVPTGILWDDTSGGDYMSTAEMGSALSAATSGGTEKLDVLFLDACLMQMIEVGYQVRNYSQYLVASEYIGWAPGPYDDYIASITPTTTASQLATAIVNEYYNELTGLIYAHTMSATDLSQYGLASVVDDFAQALTAGLPTYQTEIGSSRDACQKFYLDSYLDLYHFAFLIDQNITDVTISNAAQAVMTAVNNAVIAEAHENGDAGEFYALDNAHGISIYFPDSAGDSSYSDYNGSNLEFVADKGWDEFLAAFFGGGVTAVVSIPDASADTCNTVTVPINITDVADLGTATIWLSYNKDVVEVDSVADGDLGSIVYSIDNTTGETRMIWASATGYTGSFVFAYITLHAVGSRGDASVLDLTVIELADTSATAIPHSVADGTFTIPQLMEGDVTLDNCVRGSDAMFILQYLVDLRTLNEDQLKCADTNDDGKVTGIDAMHILQWLVDPDGLLGVLFKPLWESPADDNMLEPDPCY